MTQKHNHKYVVQNIECNGLTACVVKEMQKIILLVKKGPSSKTWVSLIQPAQEELMNPCIFTVDLMLRKLSAFSLCCVKMIVSLFFVHSFAFVCR